MTICTIDFSSNLTQFLRQYIENDSSAEELGRYTLTQFDSEVQFLRFVNQENPHIDCLIFQNSPVLQALLNQLRQQAVFLPAVVLNLSPPESASEGTIPTKFDTQEFVHSKLIYHPAVVELPPEKTGLIEWAIETAISKFIRLLPMDQTACSISPDSISSDLALPASVSLDSVDT